MLAARQSWPAGRRSSRPPISIRSNSGIATRIALRRDQPAKQQRHADVFGRRQRRQQIELLKHEADVLPAELHLAAAREPGRPVPSTTISPAVGSRMPARTDKQRRLAAAARPDQQRQLAGIDVQIDAAQRLTSELPAAVVLGHPAAGDGRRFDRRWRWYMALDWSVGNRSELSAAWATRFNNESFEQVAVRTCRGRYDSTA